MGAAANNEQDKQIGAECVLATKRHPVRRAGICVGAKDPEATKWLCEDAARDALKTFIYRADTMQIVSKTSVEI